MNNNYSYINTEEEFWKEYLPKEWELKRIGTVFEERNQKVSDVDFEPLSVTKKGIFPQWENVSKTDSHDNRKLVRKDDFVINSRSDRRGSSGLSPLDGSVSLINIVIKPSSKIEPKYSEYLFKSYDFINIFYKHGRGIVDDLWSTKYSLMKDIKICVPPKNEQTQIVSFLDTKTQKIDELIEITEQKIKLLKEKRTSLINHCVTKGLNPDVEMKDSGVEWIGDIPNHWVMEKLKYIFNEKKSSKNQHLNSGSISFGEVVYKDDQTILESTKESYQEVLIGEFLINPLNLNYDLKSLRIGLSRINVVVSQGYIILRIGEGYEPEYFRYLLRRFDIVHMKSLGQGIRQTISFTHLKNEYLVNPPIDEQIQIFNYLNEQTQKIDSTIEKETQRIELLKEYRQSLISEVVTGKIDVRDWNG